MRTFFDSDVYKAMYDHFEEGRFGTASIEKGRREPGFLELKRNGVPWMNNRVATDNEHLRWFNGYRGKILIGGLGLGLDLFKMAYYGLLDSTEITSVDVVEIDADVVGLVAPYHPHRKTDIIVGDINQKLLNPSEKYNHIICDIFHDESSLHETEKQELTTRGQSRLEPGGKIDFWH